MTSKGTEGLKIDGLKESYKKLGLTEEEIVKAAIKGLRITAKNIEGQAQDLAPRDTGTLARSIVTTMGGLPTNPDEIFEKAKENSSIENSDREETELKRITGKALNKETTIVTVSANTPYARRQHEEHSSKAKYLERPFNEKKNELENNIQNEIYKILKKKSP